MLFTVLKNTTFGNTFLLLMIVFRLSFYGRMRDIVPIDFEPLLPEKPEPKFKYIIEKSSTILINCSYFMCIILNYFVYSFSFTWSVSIQHIND